ncbi:hypothetical protein TRFO_33576 [Tritrichomonas foetus]|uniref:F5/8 type C domain-containing protein n=1 Tax=Tritrichomonas foetus TaxID=1144522 RepID=A0A1J4JNB7_9EUKA|nr:hypothetical protein TRFO_33576 [Tritrichomonas foetus]|eukprot:OHS99927.1 hypothetical protein TRFO_33576 [Tritrichomonas foetus]
MTQDIDRSSEEDDVSVDVLSRSQFDADIMEAEQNATNFVSRIYSQKVKLNIPLKDYSNSSSDDEDTHEKKYEPSKVYHYHHDKLFFNLPIKQLEEFFTSPELNKSKPDRLLRILIRISDVHQFDSSSLFNCLDFNSLSRRSKVAILENQNICHQVAFPNILDELCQTLSEKRHHSHSKSVLKHISYDSGSQEGLNSYISLLSRGNAYLKGIINITSNTKCSKCFNKSGSFESEDKPNSCVYIDFGLYCPNITSYQIKMNEDQTNIMNEWDFSGSNDLLQWDIIHSKTKRDSFNRQRIFTVTFTSTRQYRYFRLKVVGKNSGGTHEFIAGSISLFGTSEMLNTEQNEMSKKNGIIQVINSLSNISDHVFTFSSDDHLYRLLDPEWTGAYISSKEENSFVCFDYFEKKISPSYYVIKQEQIQSGFLRNWVFEGSDDLQTWTKIDSKENNNTINNSNRIGMFECHLKKKQYFRYLRIRQTGLNAGGENTLNLSFVEFFGSLLFL